MQFGQLCRGCGGGRCVDAPTALEPVRLPCKHCVDNDPACRECGGLGYTLITSCPQRLVDASTWQVLRCTRLADKGLLPVRGGVMDQSAQFLEAMDLVTAEQNAWKRKLKIYD
jgi:hypothetical protein